MFRFCDLSGPTANHHGRGGVGNPVINQIEITGRANEFARDRTNILKLFRVLDNDPSRAR
jgi:hypothetical protein